ncbi:MAG TPA: ABC transporter permease [Bacteroidetes bacterium]|nr:ABC transporter permease [Bacteroidota bacterium]
MMTFRLAWRNLWRNPRRSVVVLSSLVVGVVAAVVMDTVSRGMVQQVLENQIGSHVAHIQIHRKGFHENPEIRSTVPDADKVRKVLTGTPGLRAFSERVVSFGLLSGAATSSGVSLIGVNPEAEKKITTISASITKGVQLSGHPNEVLIGEALAEKMGVGVGDKLVGMSSATDGHVGSEMFRVAGLYKTVSSEFDKSFVFAPLPNIQQVLTLGSEVSEFAILLDDRERVEEVQSRLKSELGGAYEVLTYAEILPILVMQVEVTAQSMVIFYAIIGCALIFGIVNTMLMSVFERIREFGVLKAVGMKDGRLFRMIVLEASLLGILGTVIGFLLGYAIYLWLAKDGLDLSAFSEGLESWGVGAVVYPLLTWDVLANALIVIPLFAVLGSLYPAYRAVKLEPVKAMKYV